MNIANPLPQPPFGKSIRQVILDVAAKHGFSYLEMISDRRAAVLCWARQEAYWRCIQETVYSVPMIARHFGGRDHTTILHGVKMFLRRRAGGGPDIHPKQAQRLAEQQAYREKQEAERVAAGQAEAELAAAESAMDAHHAAP